MPRCPQCHGSYPAGQFCPKDGTRLVPHDTSPPAGQTSDPLIGQIIADRFRVVRLLGVGGMGTVYEAEHCFIKKRVALKLLRPEITLNPDALARFQREALAASTIGHENIVTIDDFGRLQDGQVYLTMEYLEGLPLNQVIHGGPLSPEEIVEVMLQTCHGLAAAHAKGIIHRDMKPENIFLTGGHRAKILDFGIAKVTRGGANDTNLTKTGAIFGTPNYMAPEQALGKPVDHRADIYAMGIILYEMLAGVVPFRSDSFLAILTQHVTKPPTPPSQEAQGRDVPPDLEQVAMRAIVKDPDGRYQDMGQMVASLLEVQKRVLGDKPLDSQLRLLRIRPPASQAPTSLDLEVGSVNPTATAGELMAPLRPPRRRHLVLGLMTALVLVLAGGVAAYVRIHGAGPLAPSAPRVKAAAMQVEPQPKVQPPKLVPPNAEALQEARTVRVLVTSSPSGASILRAGKLVGRTPESIHVTPGKAVWLVLRRTGYRDRTVKVTTVQGQDKVVEEVELVSLARGRVKKVKVKSRTDHESDHGDHGVDRAGSGGPESSHGD